MISIHHAGEINRLRHRLPDSARINLIVERFHTTVVVAVNGHYLTAHTCVITDVCAPATVTRMIDELIQQCAPPDECKPDEWKPHEPGKPREASPDQKLIQ